MTLTDRLRSATRADLDRDLLEFLGHRPGQPVHLDRKKLAVGDDAVPMAEVRAVASELLHTAPEPCRITIADLPEPE
jgi:hypothetical protein